MYCTSCGYAGATKSEVRGNVFIEIILWLAFLVPGIIYSIWRSSSRHSVCPVCQKDTLIPIDSPNAREALEARGENVEKMIEERKESKKRKLIIQIAFIIIAFVFIIWMLN